MCELANIRIKRALDDERLTAGLDFVGFAIPYRRNDRNFRAFERCFQ